MHDGGRVRNGGQDHASELLCGFLFLSSGGDIVVVAFASQAAALVCAILSATTCHGNKERRGGRVSGFRWIGEGRRCAHGGVRGEGALGVAGGGFASGAHD